MTQAEFEERKRAAHARLDVEWEQAWRDKRHGELYVGAHFSGGVPGDLVVTGDQRYRARSDE